MVAAAIIRSGTLLLAQRTYPADVAGRWELPGGKVEDGESMAAALVREIGEELGVRIGVGTTVGDPVPLRDNLILVAMHCWLIEGEPVAAEHSALRRVSAAGLREMAAAGELVPADAAWVDDLVELLT